MEFEFTAAFYVLVKTMFDVQALAAASKTVDCLKVVHSLHAYFLLVGDFDSKCIFMSLRAYSFISPANIHLLNILSIFP